MDGVIYTLCVRLVVFVYTSSSCVPKQALNCVNARALQVYGEH